MIAILLNYNQNWDGEDNASQKNPLNDKKSKVLDFDGKKVTKFSTETFGKDKSSPKGCPPFFP